MMPTARTLPIHTRKEDFSDKKARKADSAWAAEYALSPLSEACCSKYTPCHNFRDSKSGLCKAYGVRNLVAQDFEA